MNAESISPGPVSPLRFLMKASDVREGDTIKVPIRRGNTQRWEQTTVLEAEGDMHTVRLVTDQWPIDYVCKPTILVEAVDITRALRIRCPFCARNREVFATLADWVIPAALRQQGDIVAAILDPTEPEITAYCDQHFQAVLYPS